MTYTPVAVKEFGGLDLVNDPADVGFEGATVATNVVFDRGGGIRMRPGSTALNAGNTAGVYQAIKPSHSTAYVTYSPSRDEIVAFDMATGLEADAESAIDAGGIDTAVFASATYVSTGTVKQLVKWDGAAFSLPAGLATIKGYQLGVQPIDERLVVADTSTSGRLLFSNAGDPETFGVTDFVDLGETITGIVTWRDLLFVFGRTRFFIFTGNTVDSVGGTVFNYRTVDTGLGATPPATLPPAAPDATFFNHLAVAARAGVYFLYVDGVYVTVGDAPEKVSAPVDPLFPANAMSAGSYSVPSTWYGLFSVRDDVYMTTNDGTFVLSRGKWTKWHFTSGDPHYLLDMGLIAPDAALFLYTTELSLSRPQVATFILFTDSTLDVEWSYQTGYSDLGTPEQKVIREILVRGDAASVDVSIAGQATPTSVTPTGITPARARVAVRTYLAKLELAGVGAFEIREVTMYLRDARAAR